MSSPSLPVGQDEDKVVAMEDPIVEKDKMSRGWSFRRWSFLKTNLGAHLGMDLDATSKSYLLSTNS